MPFLLLLIFPILLLFRLSSKKDKKKAADRERILDKQRELLHGKKYVEQLKQRK